MEGSVPTNPRRSGGGGGNLRRPLFLLYTLLAIFAFGYWEEIQSWKNSSSLADVEIKSSSNTTAQIIIAATNSIVANTSSDRENNGYDPVTKDAVSVDDGAKLEDNVDEEEEKVPEISTTAFCDACNYEKNTPCSDRVDYLLQNFPYANPNMTVAKQNLMKVDLCIKPCTFCEQGLIDPNLIVPNTDGHTCDEIKTMASSAHRQDMYDANGAAVLCMTLQKGQGVCCPWSNSTVDDDNEPTKKDAESITDVVNTEDEGKATTATSAPNVTAIFCDTCDYRDDISCSGRVDYLLLNLPLANPTEEVAQQNLMKVGSCINPPCTFCDQSVMDPNVIVPDTHGHTCSEIKTMALSSNNDESGVAVCARLKRYQWACCPNDPNVHEWKIDVKVEYEKDPNEIMPMRNMRYENGTFVGASEWYRYWSMAKNIRRRGESSSSAVSSPRVSTIDHSHDDYVLAQVKADSKKAIEHTVRMKNRYKEVNAIPDYRARGLGWIDDKLGMVLTVIVAGDRKSNHTAALSSGNVSIFIVDTVGDIKCGGMDNDSEETADQWMEYHPPLTMWVRANGPEMFAGTALPHIFESSDSPDDRRRCAWRFDFETQTSGEYSIYVKALTFNGFADWNKDLCHTTTLQWEDKSREKFDDGEIQAAIVHELAAKGNFSHHRGLRAFKNYENISCCEACTRSRGCRMWSIPGEIDECELYFDKVEDDVDFWDRDIGKHIGRERNYSYVNQKVSEFPVVRRGLGRNERRKLAIRRSEINLPKWPKLKVPDSYGYPRDEPTLDFIGCGWSVLKSFESPCHFPSDDLIFGSGKRVEIVVDSLDRTDIASIDSALEEKRACSLEDELFGNGRWVKYPFPDDAVCMPLEQDLRSFKFRNYMPMYNGTSMPPHCWHRDHIDKCCHQCGEMGCKFIVNHRWVSDLRRTGKWFGRWENYNCYYKDMSSEEIQQCVDRKQISSIEVKGASVGNILKSFIVHKLDGIKMVPDAPTSRKVILDTLKISHMIRSLSLMEFENSLDKYAEINNATSEYYFVTGFYYSSERSNHITVDRSLQFSDLARRKLLPMGYKMINAFDATAAFTYDSDAQNDGLHIIGPPIRAILTKFFHHLCQE